jgi:hypothetical protein
MLEIPLRSYVARSGGHDAAIFWPHAGSSSDNSRFRI